MARMPQPVAVVTDHFRHVQCPSPFLDALACVVSRPSASMLSRLLSPRPMPSRPGGSCSCACREQEGQKLKEPEHLAFPTLEEAYSATWSSLKDRWGFPPKPFVVARCEWGCQGAYGLHGRAPSP